MTQTAINEKETAKAEAAKKLAADLAEEKALNEGKTGKGTRVHIGYTRGKNSQRIKYEAFDTDQPDTVPSTIAEFAELTKVDGKMLDEGVIVSMLVDGYNSAQYANASDPIQEFVNPAWPAEIAKSFKVAVKNVALGANIALEAAVAIVKPAVEANFEKQKSGQASA